MEVHADQAIVQRLFDIMDRIEENMEMAEAMERDAERTRQADFDELAEKVNVKKSAVFANSKRAQKQLAEILPDGFDAPFVTTERVLGAPVVYQGRSPAPIATARSITS